MMRTLFFSGCLIIWALLSGCASTLVGVEPSRLISIKKIAVLTIGADELKENYEMGFESLTVLSKAMYKNDNRFFPIRDWRLEDAYSRSIAGKVNKLDRYVATPVSLVSRDRYDLEQLFNRQKGFRWFDPNWDRTEPAFTRIAADAGADAVLILVLLPSPAYFTYSQNEEFKGVGISNIVGFHSNMSAMYLSASLYLVDGKTGKRMHEGVPLSLYLDDSSLILNGGRPFALLSGDLGKTTNDYRLKWFDEMDEGEKKELMQTALGLIERAQTDIAIKRLFGVQ